MRGAALRQLLAASRPVSESYKPKHYEKKQETYPGLDKK
jgi:hypothetical protein